jgi:hypothetical protein
MFAGGARCLGPAREQSAPLPSPRISRMPSRLGDLALAHLQGFGDSFSTGEIASEPGAPVNTL